MNTHESASPSQSRKSSPVEVAVRIGVLALWVMWCFMITRPFLNCIVWGVLIAVGISPFYQRLKKMLGHRSKTAAMLVTLALLLMLIGPAVPLALTVVKNVRDLAADMSDGTLTVPRPSDNVKEWPVVGEKLFELWNDAYTNLEEALKQLAPEIKAVGSWLLEAAAGAGFGLIQFLAAILISGLLLVHSKAGHRLTHNLSARLVGERGSYLADLAEATVRSVMRGVIGVALIQAALAGVGMALAGVPAAGLWTLMCLVLCIVRIGTIPVLLPAVIYVFTTGETVTAVVFCIWAIFVGVIDNVLGPLLMGRGVDVPIAVIFIGAIGGMLVSGIIGLFTGAVILALGYKLFLGWLDVDSNSIDKDSQALESS
jgi:predicted PurR-regulated permease PerM